MLNHLNLLLVIFFAIGAIRLYFLHDAAQARLQAKIITAGIFLLSILLNIGIVNDTDQALSHTFLPAMHGIPIVLSLIAVAIACFAPLVSHKPETFARIFILFAIAQLFFCFSSPVIQVLCCVLASLVVWWELSTASKSSSNRIFMIYHGMSCLMLILGAALLSTTSGHALGVTCVVIAIMIRQGVLPFHSWFTDFVQHAPIGIVLAFCIPQLTLFFKWFALIDSNEHFTMYLLITGGAFTAVYSSLLALAQSDGRRVLGYLMLSQSGFLCFAFASQSNIALQGAFLMWVNSAIALTGFALVLIAVESRRGLLNIRRANGNFAHTPKIAISFLLFGFAMVGFPSSLGYIAEDLLIQGNITQHPFLAVIVVLSTALNGFNVMRIFMMLFAGRKQPSSEPDLLRRETIAASLMVAPVFILGLLPGLVTNTSTNASHVAKIEQPVTLESTKH